MIVLGIDPGLKNSGFGIIKKTNHTTLLLDCGYLRMNPTETLSKRVGQFHYFMKEKIKQWDVTDIALETPFLGKNAQNFLKLGYLRGIVYLLGDTHGLTLHEFSPRQVKLAVTGFGNAQKDQVARAIYQLMPQLKVQEKYDITDALAVTLCGLWHQKTHNVLQTK